MSFKVKFWGVRGSIATPGARYIVYGGNTSCVEVSLGGQRVILDAGTGIRNLGHWLLRKNVKQAILLLSHTHWDHINGFPFFTPAYHKDFDLAVMSGHLKEKGGVRAILSSQMTEPTFPIPLEMMSAKTAFEDFCAGDQFTIGHGIKVRTARLNHPDGATGYRIDYHGSSLCYITDTEHVIGQPDENILGLIAGADYVIYDSTYTDREFPAKIGWGHSTWQEGLRLCRAADAKRLAIFHHDPDHEDPFMERLEAAASETWRHATVARENISVVLS